MRVLILCALTLLGTLEAQDALTVEPVRETISMLVGKGGNIAALIGDDGVILVDDQYADGAPKVIAAAAKLSQKPVRFVINTHWHADHSGGNEALAAGGAVIVAHANVRKRMSVKQFIKAFEMDVPASPKGALPTVTFTKEVSLHLNEQTIRVLHVGPAHTDTDSIVHFVEANVLHTGDTFFNGFYPFMDESSGADLDGMVQNADRMLKLCDDDTRIIPGHGPLATRSDLQAFRDMLHAVNEALKPLVASGKTLDEILAAKVTAPFDATWGGGFLKPDAFVRIAVGVIKARNAR